MGRESKEKKTGDEGSVQNDEKRMSTLVLCPCGVTVCARLRDSAGSPIAFGHLKKVPSTHRPLRAGAIIALHRCHMYKCSYKGRCLYSPLQAPRTVLLTPLKLASFASWPCPCPCPCLRGPSMAPGCWSLTKIRLASQNRVLYSCFRPLSDSFSS